MDLTPPASIIDIHDRFLLYKMVYENLSFDLIPEDRRKKLIDLRLVSIDVNELEYKLTREGLKLVEEGVAVIYPLLPNNTNKGYKNTIATMRSPAVNSLFNTMIDMSEVVATKLATPLAIKFVTKILSSGEIKLTDEDINDIVSILGVRALDIENINSPNLAHSVSQLYNIQRRKFADTIANKVGKRDIVLNKPLKLKGRNIEILAIKDGDRLLCRNTHTNEEVVTSMDHLGITLIDLLSVYQEIND